MQRICFVLQVRPERLEEYKERHHHVWPEMQDALRETGWHNYSMFLRPDGLLVGYFETEDLQHAITEMKKRPISDRWQSEMAPMMFLAEGTKPDDALMNLEEIFHLNS